MTPPRAPRHVRRTVSAAEREHVAGRLAGVLADEDVVVFAYLFGSFADGRPFEDVDVAVFLDPARARGLDTLTVRLDLTGRLEAAAGVPVDLILLHEADLGLRGTALRGRLLMSRDEAQRIAYLEETSLALMDMAALRRQALRDLLGG